MSTRLALGAVLLLLITGCSSDRLGIPVFHGGGGTGSSSAATAFQLEVDVHSTPSRIHAKDVYFVERNGQVNRIGNVVRIDAIQSTGSAIHIALTGVPRVPRDVSVSVCSNRIELHLFLGSSGPLLLTGMIVPFSRSRVVDGPC